MLPPTAEARDHHRPSLKQQRETLDARDAFSLGDVNVLIEVGGRPQCGSALNLKYWHCPIQATSQGAHKRSVPTVRSATGWLLGGRFLPLPEGIGRFVVAAAAAEKHQRH
jgi:hypothetical protein